MLSIAGSTGFSGSTGFTGATGDTGFTGATGFTGKALPQHFVCAVIMDNYNLIISNIGASLSCSFHAICVHAKGSMASFFCRIQWQHRSNRLHWSHWRHWVHWLYGGHRFHRIYWRHRVHRIHRSHRRHRVYRIHRCNFRWQLIFLTLSTTFANSVVQTSDLRK